MNNSLSYDENSRASINQDTRYVKDTYQKRPENEYVVKEMSSAFPLPGLGICPLPKFNKLWSM